MNEKRYSGVLVKCNNQFLLCKRNLNENYAGVWSIPGGMIEVGETTSEAAKREFFEETSINIDDLKLSFIGIVNRNEGRGENIPSFMYVYLIETEHKIVPNLKMAIDGYEHSECGYFSEDELETMEVDTEVYELIINKFV